MGTRHGGYRLLCLLQGAMGVTAERGSMRTAGMTFCIRFACVRHVVTKSMGQEIEIISLLYC